MSAEVRNVASRDHLRVLRTRGQTDPPDPVTNHTDCRETDQYVLPALVWHLDLYCRFSKGNDGDLS